MNDQELKDLEKNALDWYARQPMGSAVRQNGPAAIQGYMAGAADMYKLQEEKILDYDLRKLISENTKKKVAVVTLPQ